MRPVLLPVFFLSFVSAQDAPVLSRGRPAMERIAPERLEAVHQAREKLARERKNLPEVGVYREFKVTMHFGTRAEALKAAKAAGISVAMYAGHRAPKPDTWQGMHDGVLFFAGAEDNHLQTYPRPVPGDAEDDKDLLGYLSKLKDDPAARRSDIFERTSLRGGFPQHRHSRAGAGSRRFIHPGIASRRTLIR